LVPETGHREATAPKVPEMWPKGEGRGGGLDDRPARQPALRSAGPATAS